VTLTPEHPPADAGPDRGLSLQWQWGWASAIAPDPDDDEQAWAAQLTIPDSAAMKVELRAEPGPSGSGATLTVLQRDVLACDAVQLGLIWEYYLAQAQAVTEGEPSRGNDLPPWTEMLTQLAVREANERAAQRHRDEENQKSLYGGYLPSPRPRSLQANVVGLAHMDRQLLDALADDDSQRQRAVAVWAAREACTVSRLVEVDWINQALTLVESGQPLPEAFRETSAIWDRLWADPAAPATVVIGPRGMPNCSQQAMALPALLATAESDPLSAAVNALYAAAIAHGPAWPGLVERARRQFPELAGGFNG
jgi:hypothetical protein